MTQASLYLGDDDLLVGHHEFAGGEVVVYSSRSPGKTTPNEDAAAVIPLGNGSGVLAVADGVGGLRGGREAAGIAVKRLVEFIQEPVKGDELLRTRILNAIESANEDVIALGVGAGATLAVAEICEGMVRSYHVGDAAVMLVGQRGKIKFMTVPHSPIGLAVEAGFMDEEEAIHHEDRHLVFNMIGANDMHIDVGPSLRMAVFDRVLVASDGLFDNLMTNEIVDRIRKGSVVDILETLSADALTRMIGAVPGHPSKPDDLTFIVGRQGRRAT